jgi:transposase
VLSLVRAWKILHWKRRFACLRRFYWLALGRQIPVQPYLHFHL